MADKIIFKFPEMNNAATQIKGFSKEYETAATTFVQAITTATAEWEGASKDKFIDFITNAVKPYIGTTIPEVVDGLAQMLDANAEQMQNADAEIAKAIPESLS